MQVRLPKKPSRRVRIQLSDEQVRSFAESGFVAVERITTDEEIEWLRNLYDRLFAERRAGIAGGFFDLSRPYDSEGTDLIPQVLLPEKLVPELLETNFYRNGRRLAAQLLGVAESVLQVGGHMIFKPARIARALPWHQDEAYWDPRFDYHAVGVWMPLDAATVESGCLQFIPGSHRLAVLPHRHIGNDPSIHGLATDEVDRSQSPCRWPPAAPRCTTAARCTTRRPTPPPAHAGRTPTSSKRRR